MWWCGTVFVAFCFERGTPRKPFSWSQQQSTRRASNAAHSSTQTTTRAIGTLYPRLVMHILTHILLICLWIDVIWAQASAPGPSPAQKTNNEDLSELALWPDVDIRGLLVGETNATEKTPSPVDLLFVLQADSATLVPASDGGLLGGHLLQIRSPSSSTCRKTCGRTGSPPRRAAPRRTRAGWSGGGSASSASNHPPRPRRSGRACCGSIWRACCAPSRTTASGRTCATRAILPPSCAARPDLGSARSSCARSPMPAKSSNKDAHITHGVVLCKV